MCVPPSDGIGDIFHISLEIVVGLWSEVCQFGRSESGEHVKNDW